MVSLSKDIQIYIQTNLTFIIHQLYIHYTFVIHSVVNSYTENFTIKYSFYIQFHIPRHSILQLYIRYTLSSKFKDIIFHNQIFVTQLVHSVPIQFSSNWYIIHLLYIQFQFQLDIQIHIETNLTFGIYSLYIQFHILRHDISQFDIRQTFSYRFRATFSDGTFHNKIFVIHPGQNSLTYRYIFSLVLHSYS